MEEVTKTMCTCGCKTPALYYVYFSDKPGAHGEPCCAAVESYLLSGAVELDLPHYIRLTVEEVEANRPK